MGSVGLAWEVAPSARVGAAQGVQGGPASAWDVLTGVTPARRSRCEEAPSGGQRSRGTWERIIAAVWLYEGLRSMLPRWAPGLDAAGEAAPLSQCLQATASLR